MKRLPFLKCIVQTAFYILLFAGLFAGCKDAKEYFGSKKEYAAYDEITYNAANPVNVEITGQTGNIEIYNWDEEAVKFEIAKKVRVAGESFSEKLENIKIISSCENRKDIILEWKYEGPKSGDLDYYVDLRVFLPKKVELIKFKMDIGKVIVYDDLKCEMLANFNMVNIKMNKFEGKLILNGEMGNVQINGGTIKNGTEVKVDMGNINIKAGYETGDSYYLETRTGNIDLALPRDSAVSFENNGYVQVNEFEPGDYPVKIRIVCDMGKICIYKY